MFVALFAHACAPPTPPPIDGPVEILEVAPTLAEPVNGFVIYSLPGDPDRADEAPWVRALFDGTPAHVSDITELRDQCVLDFGTERLHGVVDLGRALTMTAGDDELRLLRALDYFGKDGVDYIFTTERPDIGAQAGSPLALEGRSLGAVVPSSIVVHEPDDTTRPWSTRCAYDGDLATATDTEAVFCYFIDDGRASVDLSAVLPAGWPTYTMRVTRRSLNVVEHRELDRVVIEADREVRLSPQ